MYGEGRRRDTRLSNVNENHTWMTTKILFHEWVDIEEIREEEWEGNKDKEKKTKKDKKGIRKKTEKKEIKKKKEKKGKRKEKREVTVGHQMILIKTSFLYKFQRY